MAAVYAPQPPQQQAPPVVPIYQTQAATQSRDPLFDALVKYVTQGAGPSSVTAEDIQTIIDAQAGHPEGRAYLESIVAPAVETPLRIWKNSIDVSGFLSTNLSSWTIVLSGRSTGVGIPYAVNLRLSGLGFFFMQVQEFNDVKFFWDNFSGTETVYAEVTVEGAQVVVKIYGGEVRIPEAKSLAEVSFPAGHLKLPPISFGKGPLSIAQ